MKSAYQSFFMSTSTYSLAKPTAIMTSIALYDTVKSMYILIHDLGVLLQNK